MAMQWERRWLDIFAEDVARNIAAAEACQIADRAELAYQGLSSSIQARTVSGLILLTLDERRDQRDFERFDLWLSKAKKLEGWFKATFIFTRRADGTVEVVQKANLTIRHVSDKARNTTNKLTDEQRKELMDMIRNGQEYAEIARAYGITTSTVGYYADKVKKLNGHSGK